MRITPLVRDTPDGSRPLNSRAVVGFLGASYLCIGLAFSFLDRRYGSFPVESALWAVWACLGFGGAWLRVGQPASGGQTHWKIQGWIGFALAVFPGFIMFSLLRWVALTLMIVIGARAAILATQRDFYFTLTVLFVMSVVVVTHGNANWLLWLYLAPAWFFAGLALTWEYASGTPIARGPKALMNSGFVLLCLGLTLAIYLALPRPQIMGFGFLPPGTEHPGLFKQAAGASPGGPSAGGASGGREAGGAAGSGSYSGSGSDSWAQAIKDMRAALGDGFIPLWQRTLMGHALDGVQSLLEKINTFTLHLSLWSLLRLLLLCALGYLLWRRRYKIALSIALGWAWLLAGRWPRKSMGVCATAMKWCLHVQGHPRLPGQSVREHWSSVKDVHPLARRWLGHATEIYCEARFGTGDFSSRRAHQMHQAVQSASELMTESRAKPVSP